VKYLTFSTFYISFIWLTSFLPYFPYSASIWQWFRSTRECILVESEILSRRSKPIFAFYNLIHSFYFFTKK